MKKQALKPSLAKGVAYLASNNTPSHNAPPSSPSAASSATSSASFIHQASIAHSSPPNTAHHTHIAPPNDASFSYPSSLHAKSPPNASHSPYALRIQALQHRLAQEHITAYLILSTDPHISEYRAKHFHFREFLSGFSGSAGVLLVLQDRAFLWTDGRYFLQAEQELLNSGITLQKQDSTNTYLTYINTHFTHANTLATNAKLLPIYVYHELLSILEAKGAKLRADVAFEEELWEQDIEPRPPLIFNKIYPLRAEFCDAICREKLELIREAMRHHRCDAHLLSSTEDIAWVCNMRGSDVACNPIFYAYLLITMDRAILFLGEGALDARDSKSSDIDMMSEASDLQEARDMKGGLIHDVKDSKKPKPHALALQHDFNASPDKDASHITHMLITQGLEIQPYHTLFTHLASLRDMRLLLDPSRSTLATLLALDASVSTHFALNPSTLLKSRKSPREIAHIIESMRLDGVALCEFFTWLEAELHARLTHSLPPLTEVDIDTHLTAFRKKSALYISNSFDTIAGFNHNGALPHYRANSKACANIIGDGLLLIDSGAQYHCGTTDITRVLPIGSINDEQKRDYTLVLKALIAISGVVFPRDTPLPMLDSLARLTLWREGLDYTHGTGHGVGFFLNVHEGPQVLSLYVTNLKHKEAKEGMIISLEPGIYRRGQWGVRLENLVALVGVETRENNGAFLGFKTLSLCPFEAECITWELLDEGEKAWLKAYHKRVLEELGGRVSKDAKAWLKHKCEGFDAR